MVEAFQVLPLMMRRAPIMFALLFVFMGAWAYSAVWLLECVRDKTTRQEPDAFNYQYLQAEWTGVRASVAIACSAVFCFVTALVVGGTLVGVVAGLVMPEYVALRQLLK